MLSAIREREKGFKIKIFLFFFLQRIFEGRRRLIDRINRELYLFKFEFNYYFIKSKFNSLNVKCN